MTPRAETFYRYAGEIAQDLDTPIVAALASPPPTCRRDDPGPLESFATADALVPVTRLLRSGMKSIHLAGIAGDVGRDAVLLSLARSLAETGRRILVVDADVDGPSLAESGSPGLTDVMARTERLAKLVVPSPGYKGMMAFLPIGTRPQDLEAPGSVRPLVRALEEARPSYDVTLVSAPCLDRRGKVHPVATACEAVLLVLSPGVVSRDRIRRNFLQLWGVESPIRGLITLGIPNVMPELLRDKHREAAGDPARAETPPAEPERAPRAAGVLPVAGGDLDGTADTRETGDEAPDERPRRDAWADDRLGRILDDGRAAAGERAATGDLDRDAEAGPGARGAGGGAGDDPPSEARPDVDDEEAGSAAGTDATHDDEFDEETDAEGDERARRAYGEDETYDEDEDEDEAYDEDEAAYGPEDDDGHEAADEGDDVSTRIADETEELDIELEDGGGGIDFDVEHLRPGLIEDVSETDDWDRDGVEEADGSLEDEEMDDEELDREPDDLLERGRQRGTAPSFDAGRSRKVEEPELPFTGAREATPPWDRDSDEPTSIQLDAGDGLDYPPSAHEGRDRGFETDEIPGRGGAAITGQEDLAAVEERAQAARRTAGRRGADSAWVTHRSDRSRILRSGNLIRFAAAAVLVVILGIVFWPRGGNEGSYLPDEAVLTTENMNADGHAVPGSGDQGTSGNASSETPSARETQPRLPADARAGDSRSGGEEPASSDAATTTTSAPSSAPPAPAPATTRPTGGGSPATGSDGRPIPGMTNAHLGDAAPYYGVHITSFRDEKRAWDDATRLARVTGHQADVIEHVITEKGASQGRWFRVVVGRFSDPAEAERAARRIIEKGITDYARVYRIEGP